MPDRRRLYLVPKIPPLASQPPIPTARQLPPIKPRRPAAAVRKSLQVALAASTGVAGAVAEADARIPAKARKAVDRLDAHAKRVARLVDELRHAVECEARYHLWRRGKSYVE